MRIQLIDVDSTIPNLALMQISRYYKERGDIVGFDIDDPDEVYISCVFKENGPTARGIAKFFPGAKIHLGGSGVCYDWLPADAQKVYPDYDLYPMAYSLGYTTRGCVRNCGFCIVRKKEGKFRRWQPISFFYSSKFKNVILLDNNVYADKKWFFENTDFLLQERLRWNPIQGMDIRLLDLEIAQRLKELAWSGNMHFAFDSMLDERAVRRGIKLLQKVGINIRQNVQFYVLVGYDTTQEQDKYRCRLLKKLGTNAFVMPYVKNKWTRRIARWANRKWLYWSIDIDEYKR